MLFETESKLHDDIQDDDDHHHDYTEVTHLTPSVTWRRVQKPHMKIEVLRSAEKKASS